MSTSEPSIGFLGTSTSGHAVVELTSSRIDSPPWRVSNQNSSTNNDGTDVLTSGPRAYRSMTPSVSVREPSSWSRPRC